MEENMFSLQEIATAFMVLFAVIDITGSIPVVINLMSSGRRINPHRAALLSFIVIVVFMLAGEAVLRLFNVDISSFAIAGALVLFVLGVEMLLGIEIFRNEGPGADATIIPVVFPLVAGAGVLTTTLSLLSEVRVQNLLVAVVLNMVIVYLVLRNLRFFERLLGQGGIFVLRKFFGVILLAMSVRMFVSNLAVLLRNI
jgi:multiple antibiotic resistance protein